MITMNACLMYIYVPTPLTLQINQLTMLYGQKFVDPFYTQVVLFHTVATNVEAHGCIGCLFAVPLPLAFTGTTRTKPVPACQCPYKASSMKTWIAMVGVSGLHRALTPTPLKIFKINWNTDFTPGLLARHQYLTSLMLCWLNGQIPTAMLQNLAENLSRSVEDIIIANGGRNLE